MGTNKAIADTVALTPCLVAAAHYSGANRLRKRAVVIFAFMAVIAAAGFAAFFARTQTTREGTSAQYGYFVGADAVADYDNFTLRYVAEPWQVGVLSLNSYFTQGYYATSLSLKEPFEPMWGVGNSFFLSRQVSRLPGDPSFERAAYPFRIEKMRLERIWPPVLNLPLVGIGRVVSRCLRYCLPDRSVVRTVMA
jgi:hypothetical protein